MQRRALLGVLTVSVLGLALPESAQGHSPSGFGFGLEDDAGLPFQTFQHRGTRWVLGVYGESYRIRLQNPGPTRLEAVVTVDGRDVVSGRLGDTRQARGYVLGPYATLTIDGFRQSLSHVARFRFTSSRNSYSARLGTPEHVGVVGVAFFREAAPWPRPRPSPRAGTERGRGDPSRAKEKGPPGDASAPHADEQDRLGTEYGNSEYRPVQEVPFRRALSRPDAVLVLRYDDEHGLRARGILPPPRPAPDSPDPFPGDRFAAPPP